MKAEALKRMAVVSIGSGEKVGYVDDVEFDTAQLRVAALRVVADGQQAFIPFESISSVGSDAVTVPSHDVAQWVKSEGAAAGLRSLDDMGKLKIVDEAGTLLGTISGLEIDPQSGSITEVQAHQGGVLGIGGTTHRISAGDIRSVGGEIMVVASTDGPS